MIDKDRFCILILTHGRANNVITYSTIRKKHCTSEIIFVIDNEDKQAQDYYDLYDGKDNCRVHTFDKLEVSKRVDSGDLIADRRAPLFARNEVYNIAKQYGYEYFIILEDDYTDFDYRFTAVKHGEEVLAGIPCTDLDTQFGNTMQYLADNPILSAVCYAQGGDFIGGVSAFYAFNNSRFRKAMNVFFCATDRPLYWYGRINEDVSGYVHGGSKGNVFISFRNVSITQSITQSLDGGTTDLYEKFGTYTKSFYSVLYSPSCVKISVIRDSAMRIHHRVEWDCAVPKILSDKYKKSSNHVKKIEVI